MLYRGQFKRKCFSSSISSNVRLQYLHFLCFLAILGLACLPVSIANVYELILNLAMVDILFKFGKDKKITFHTIILQVWNIHRLPSVSDLTLDMHIFYVMCVLYTFSFGVSNSLLFLSIKFNSGIPGSEISKDARRVVTSVHQFDCPMLCSCTRVSKAFLSGSSAWRFNILSQYLITYKFLLNCSGKCPVSLYTASVGVCILRPMVLFK